MHPWSIEAKETDVAANFNRWVFLNTPTAAPSPQLAAYTIPEPPFLKTSFGETNTYAATPTPTPQPRRLPLRFLPATAIPPHLTA